MEYIYIRIYAYVCNDGTNIEFYDIILYTIVTIPYHRQGTTCEAFHHIASHGFSLVCRHWPCKVRAKLHRLLFHFRLRPWENFRKMLGLSLANIIRT